MLYHIESDNKTLKGKLLRPTDVQFRVGERIEHNGFRYKITYITHVFNDIGAYQHTNVGLDR
jgi:uncharacterized Zn finger protein